MASLKSNEKEKKQNKINTQIAFYKAENVDESHKMKACKMRWINGSAF
jgi:hypothetical protein